MFRRSMVAGLALLCASSLQAQTSYEPNRVINGGFETGSTNPWTATNVTLTSIAHSGNYGATFTGGGGVLRQAIPTGGPFEGPLLLSFWYEADPGATSLVLTWGGFISNPIFIVINPSPGSWTRVALISVGEQDGDFLTGINFNGSAGIHLDDISVQSLPENGGTLILLSLGVLAVLSWRKRSRSFPA